MGENMPLFQGRHSKLVRLFERLVRDRIQVEIELINGEVFYGTLNNFEFTSNYLIVTLDTSNNKLVINFQYVLRMRVKSTNKQ